MHACNRPLHKTEELIASMLRHGFMPSSPIHCIRNGGGKLKVIRGHHRLTCAKKLGIPVWYVVDDTNTDIFALEGDSRQRWSLHDFAEARRRDGDLACKALLAFRKKHCLPLGVAASLVGGQSAGSCNRNLAIKRGIFRIGDMKHANAVARVTDACMEKGISFANSKAFVSAVSMVLLIPEFDVELFMHRVSVYCANLRKRSTMEHYLDEIEALYNYNSKSKRMPVAFRAREEARRRNPVKQPKIDLAL
jgi:hypothetical protein